LTYCKEIRHYMDYIVKYSDTTIEFYFLDVVQGVGCKVFNKKSVKVRVAWRVLVRKGDRVTLYTMM